MSREELYSLVWQTPLSRLAKSFGLSDVGLRKICVKHDIPTPPLGYWAKRVHGKQVHQPPLPPATNESSNTVYLVMRTGPVVPPSVTAAQEDALAHESEHPAIVVPSERPVRLHLVAAATAKALRAAKVDHEGFKHANISEAVDVMVGVHSIDRALAIIDAFACALQERGYAISSHEDGVQVVVNDVPFLWRLHEIKDRGPHQPTKEELKAQASREESRARWPSLYSSRDTKAYRSWDYFPSGRLAMTLFDGTRRRWDQDRLVGRWHDRKGKRLEDCLDEAMAALVTSTVAISHRLAEEAERARRRNEEHERRKREQARQERALKRHEFVLKKAEDYVRYQSLSTFAEFLERKVYRYSGEEVIDRLIGELKTLVTLMGQNFEREAMQEEIVRLQLYTDDDAVADPDGLEHFLE